METKNRGTQQYQGHATGGTAGTRTAEPEGVIGTIAEKASEMAESAASAAGDAWDATRQGVQQAASAAAATAGDAWDDVARLVRRYPVAALCAGLGVGFLLGCALRGTGPSHFLSGNWGGYPAPSGGRYPFAK